MSYDNDAASTYVQIKLRYIYEKNNKIKITENNETVLYWIIYLPFSYEFLCNTFNISLYLALCFMRKKEETWTERKLGLKIFIFFACICILK